MNIHNYQGLLINLNSQPQPSTAKDNFRRLRIQGILMSFDIVPVVWVLFSGIHCFDLMGISAEQTLKPKA